MARPILLVLQKTNHSCSLIYSMFVLLRMAAYTDSSIAMLKRNSKLVCRGSLEGTDFSSRSAKRCNSGRQQAVEHESFEAAAASPDT